MDDSDDVMKILVVGGPAVGKTSFVKRYVSGTFVESKGDCRTIGVDFAIKRIKSSNGASLCAQLWDMAGQERNHVMSKLYYQNVDDFVVMLDVANQNALDQAYRLILNYAMKADVPRILVANKVDLHEQRCVFTDELKRFAVDENFLAFFETSVKENTNVGEAFRFLVKEVLKSRGQQDNGLHGSGERHTGPTEPTDTIGDCCWSCF